jgi:hypothetical protein
MFHDVTVDIIKNESFSDVVVLFRNDLRPEFEAKHRALIASCEKSYRVLPATKPG